MISGQKNKLDFLDDKDKGNKNKGQKREVQDKNHQ
jgi:hypothetical protein